MDERAQPTFFTSSNSALSKTAASGQLNVGSTVGSTIEFLSKNANVYRFVIVHRGGSSIIFYVLRSWRPSSSTSTRLSPLNCLLAKSSSAHTNFSHTPLGGAWAGNTFASLLSVLSCVISTLRGFPQPFWPPHAAHLPIALLPPVLDETHEAHVRQCDPGHDDPPQKIPCSLARSAAKCSSAHRLHACPHRAFLTFHPRPHSELVTIACRSLHLSDAYHHLRAADQAPLCTATLLASFSSSVSMQPPRP